MPRGKAKPKEVPEAASVFTSTAVENKIDALTASVNKLVEVLTKPKETPVEEPVTVSTAQVSMSNGFPIPYEYSELVNTLLNSKFKVEINYIADQAAFSFEILVPKEYSNASEAHWQTYKEDRRGKVIQNAYGANGVREWVLHVYENFSPEIQSMITYDRGQILKS